MFGGVLVENGIGIVDVDENFAAVGVAGELGQQAVVAGERKVAHFARSFAGAAGAAEFIVGPEGAVHEGDVGGGSELLPFRAVAGERGSDEDFFAGGLKEKTDGSLLGR